MTSGDSRQQFESNDQLLENAEQYMSWARRNYGNRPDGNDIARTAAMISMANSLLVVARQLVASEVQVTIDLPSEMLGQPGPESEQHGNS
jgi:hypothetical protein